MKKSVMSLVHQLLMYLGTFIGVLLSTAVNHFINAENFLKVDSKKNTLFSRIKIYLSAYGSNPLTSR